MRYTFFLIILIVFLGGCITITDSRDTDFTPAPDNGGTTTYGGTTTNGIPISDGVPLISTSIRPSNPDRGETFTITVTADDAVGVSSISWGSPDSFLVLPDIGSFDCGQQKICTVNWEFSSSQDGLKTITVYATDSAGQESRRATLEINVLPYDFIPPKIPVCGNGICESGETAINCSQDCGVVGPVCGDGTCDSSESTTICPSDCQETVVIDEGECNSNSDCGYKEVCRSGTCRDVECTNSGQCSGCKRCSSNSCVSCGSGPYGCYC